MKKAIRSNCVMRTSLDGQIFVDHVYETNTCGFSNEQSAYFAYTAE